MVDGLPRHPRFRPGQRLAALLRPEPYLPGEHYIEGTKVELQGPSIHHVEGDPVRKDSGLLRPAARTMSGSMPTPMPPAYASAKSMNRSPHEIRTLPLTAANSEAGRRPTQKLALLHQLLVRRRSSRGGTQAAQRPVEQARPHGSPGNCVRREGEEGGIDTCQGTSGSDQLGRPSVGGRPRDLLDVRALFVGHGDAVERRLLRHWKISPLDSSSTPAGTPSAAGW
jgi:hypothetical protein